MPTLWANQMEVAVAIDGNKVTVTNHPDEHQTAVEEFTITAISDNEFSATMSIWHSTDSSF